MIDYGFSKIIDLSFNETETRIKEELEKEG
jgi:hypothetical protein